LRCQAWAWGFLVPVGLSRCQKTTGRGDDIMGLLEKLWRDRGLTLIVVTHDSATARRAQRIGIMRKGRLTIKRDTRRPV
jgi:predicted ABC-type transport system involved in lysophospholipase L1 biosynthesis ATPase subunit